MAEHGGKRTPRNPAPVSGPGRMSRRTDGGPGSKQPMQDLPDAAYGEARDMKEIQQGAPQAGAPVDTSNVVPLGAPSGRPEEPVTAGADMGEGVGMEAAGITPEEKITDEDMQKLQNILPSLEFMANQPGAYPSTVALVRRLKAGN